MVLNSCRIRRQDLLFHPEERNQLNSITLVLKTNVPSQIISPTSLLCTNSHQFKYGGVKQVNKQPRDLIQKDNVRRELERAMWREREEKTCMGMCILVGLQESNKNEGKTCTKTKKPLRERSTVERRRQNN